MDVIKNLTELNNMSTDSIVNKIIFINEIEHEKLLVKHLDELVAVDDVDSDYRYNIIRIGMSPVQHIWFIDDYNKKSIIKHYKNNKTDREFIRLTIKLLHTYLVDEECFKYAHEQSEEQFPEYFIELLSL